VVVGTLVHGNGTLAHSWHFATGISHQKPWKYLYPKPLGPSTRRSPFGTRARAPGRGTPPAPTARCK
jgi:hypothetical protein